MAYRQVAFIIRPLEKLFSFHKVAFFLFGISKNGFGSIDITNARPLQGDCRSFLEQDDSPQWSLEQWRAHFDAMKSEGSGFFHCTWGGEPLLRPDVLELGRRYFRYNTVITNGLLPLPAWKDVSWHIAVDGNRRQYERLQNAPGHYDTIQRTIQQSQNLKITIAYCITSGNFRDIENSLDEWGANPKVHSMVFSFVTPARGGDDSLWLGWEERDRLLDLLISKKKVYGNFIANTPRMLKMMKSDMARSVTDNCPFAEKSFAFDPVGRRKRPCMLGPQADCDRCGSVVPFYLKSLTSKKLIIADIAKSIKVAFSSLLT